MYHVPRAYHTRIIAGEIPNTYCVVASDMGNHIYSLKPLGGFFRTMTISYEGIGVSGTLKDTSGNLYALEISDNLAVLGSLVKTIQPKTRDVINTLSSKEKQNITVELNNHDYSISKQFPKDPFLNRKLYIYSGFENDTIDDQLMLFVGKIIDVEVSRTTVSLMVEEL